MARHILVLGATGPSGVLFCRKALDKGYKLTILARNPSKLPREVLEHPDVVAVKGGFEDDTQTREALSTGATTLVSFAGPKRESQGTPVTDFYHRLFPYLIEKGFDRAMILCTASWSAPEDKWSMKWTMMIKLLQLISKDGYKEMYGIGSFVASQPANQLKWTLFRVPMLVEGDEGNPVQAAFVGSGDDGMKLTRGSMARWVLEEMEDCQWVGRAPTLSNEWCVTAPDPKSSPA